MMEALHSTIAFVGTIVLARRYLCKRSFATADIPASLSEAYKLSNTEVEQYRAQYVSNSCSVSYANSGPLHIIHGKGTRLIDIHGHSYLDTRNNVAHVGHGHPDVVRAITYQVEQLNTNTRYLHPNASLLAKKLSDLLPEPLDVVFFVNSGSEANDLALRLARAYKDSKLPYRPNTQHNIITIDHAYHGHTLATLDVSPYKHRQGTEMRCPDYVRRVPYPDLYRGTHSGTSDEEEAAQKYASYVETACEELSSDGNSLSAFIMEGGMSVAGVILSPRSYVKRCVEAIHKAGAVYIADEVQTGFGRLGSCMWAFQYSNDGEVDEDGIVPDIVTVGKPFGNGMPLAAVVTNRRIASAFESLGVEYFNTFAGNPVCCASGLAMLDVLSKERLQQNALTVGNYLIELFRDVQSRHPIIGCIRGSGLFIGVELVKDGSLEPATKETSFMCSTLKVKYQVLTSVDGFYENVIVIKPPMCFSKEDAVEFVACFEKVLVVDLPVAINSLAEMGKTPT